MRTSEEIISRIEQLKSNNQDILGFRKEALASFLTYDEFREAFGLLENLKDRQAWDAPVLTQQNILKAMADYMLFAWMNVEDHRGISASRSVEKMEEWVWLLADEQLLADVKATPYPQYGAPRLKLICERLGFPIPESVLVLRMAEGLFCEEGCRSGCGT